MGGESCFPPPFSKVDGGEFGYFPPHFQNGWGGNWLISHQAMGGENFWPPDVMGGTTFLVSPPIGWRGKLKLSQKRRELSRKTRFWADFGQSMGGDNFFMGGDNFRPPPRFEHRGGGIFVPPHGSDTLGGEFFWCPPPPWGGNVHPCRHPNLLIVNTTDFLKPSLFGHVCIVMSNYKMSH